MEARLAAATEAERSGLLDELARAGAAGDGEAAATLAWAVQRFCLATPAIRQYLFRQADIDTAEQLTLIAVAYRIGSFRGDSRFTTWLHRVASNEAKQVVRSESRHHDRGVAPASEATERSAQDAPGDDARRRLSSLVADRVTVEREIAQLPERLRRALVLREHDGLSYVEVAEALGVPEGTAKTWVRRGRAQLAARLASQMEL